MTAPEPTRRRTTRPRRQPSVPAYELVETNAPDPTRVARVIIRLYRPTRRERKAS